MDWQVVTDIVAALGHFAWVFVRYSIFWLVAVGIANLVLLVILLWLAVHPVQGTVWTLAIGLSAAPVLVAITAWLSTVRGIEKGGQAAIVRFGLAGKVCQAAFVHAESKDPKLAGVRLSQRLTPEQITKIREVLGQFERPMLDAAANPKDGVNSLPADAATPSAGRKFTRLKRWAYRRLTRAMLRPIVKIVETQLPANGEESFVTLPRIVGGVVDAEVAKAFSAMNRRALCVGVALLAVVHLSVLSGRWWP